MQAAIVSSSTLRKYGRWDVGFYLKDQHLVESERRAKKRLRQAVAAVRLARRRIRENDEKIKMMVDAGEVVVLKEQL